MPLRCRSETSITTVLIKMRVLSNRKKNCAALKNLWMSDLSMRIMRAFSKAKRKIIWAQK
jgi:hypothetical protein